MIVFVFFDTFDSFFPYYLLSPLLFVIAFIIPLQLCCLSSPCFSSPFLVVIIGFVGHYHHCCSLSPLVLVIALLFVFAIMVCHHPYYSSLGNCKLRWLFLDTLGVHFDQILTLKHLSHKHHHVTLTFEEPKFIL